MKPDVTANANRWQLNSDVNDVSAAVNVVPSAEASEWISSRLIATEKTDIFKRAKKKQISSSKRTMQS